ncbi:Gfo/Idh/MocA family protein [Brevibacillus fluminis]|uniref:Gfo/Idh/MocA family protein n=1 Tax=Brevibacillus fluminis TaxID=511487 RepID=UPI003F8AF553
MMSKQIQVGIIGLGGMGGKLFHTFLAHPDFQVTAVCDTDAKRAEEAAKGAGDLPWYTEYQLLLQEAALDLVYIAVPPAFHHRIALDVLAAGKHILCEKPLANTLEEAEEMRETARRAGVVHAMNFPTYYRAAFRELSARMAQGFLGEVRRVEITTHFHQWPRPWQQNPWIGGREQGGFVREVMPHYIHLTQSLFGKVAAVDSQLEYPEDPQACETGIVATLRLEDGPSVLMNGVSQIARKERVAFTLYGTKGTLALVDWSRLEGGGVGEELAEIAVGPTDHLADMLTQLASTIRTGEGDVVDFEAGYDVQNVLEKLLQSRG